MIKRFLNRLYRTASLANEGEYPMGTWQQLVINLIEGLIKFAGALYLVTVISLPLPAFQAEWFLRGVGYLIGVYVLMIIVFHTVETMVCGLIEAVGVWFVKKEEPQEPQESSPSPAD